MLLVKKSFFYFYGLTTIYVQSLIEIEFLFCSYLAFVLLSYDVHWIMTDLNRTIFVWRIGLFNFFEFYFMQACFCYDFVILDIKFW